MLSAVDVLARRLRRVEGNDYAGIAAGVSVVTLANAGTPYKGYVLFISNGRKVGEGAGSGTGVLAYGDGVQWRRASDDTTVAV